MNVQRPSDIDELGRPEGVVGAHALLAPRELVLQDRRALYGLAASLISGESEPSMTTLDHPVTRHRIGEHLAGRLPAAQFRMPRASDLVEPGAGTGAGPAVASRTDSAELLAPALRSVAAEAGVPAGTLGLITRADGDRFNTAAAAVAAGLDRARDLVPDLMTDLEGHVAVVAVLDPKRSGTVVSASSRNVPGLVLLRPGGALDVAESLVHEAAHQRLFDMAITRDLLLSEADGHHGFRPSWRQVVWPIEQTLAAFHAYACLAELARAVPASALRSALGPFTVLPNAVARAAELGQWLADNAHLLGSDADRLVRAILGRPAATTPPVDSSPLPFDRWIGRMFRAEHCRVVPSSDGRFLVGLPGSPPRLFWLDADPSIILQSLDSAGPLPVDQVVRGFENTMQIRDAGARVGAALNTLVLTGLARVS